MVGDWVTLVSWLVVDGGRGSVNTVVSASAKDGMKEFSRVPVFRVVTYFLVTGVASRQLSVASQRKTVAFSPPFLRSLTRRPSGKGGWPVSATVIKSLGRLPQQDVSSAL